MPVAKSGLRAMFTRIPFNAASIASALCPVTMVVPDTLDDNTAFTVR